MLQGLGSRGKPHPLVGAVVDELANGDAKMDAEKQQRLEAAGWQVGSVEDFLDLTPEELQAIDRLGDLLGTSPPWERKSSDRVTSKHKRAKTVEALTAELKTAKKFYRQTQNKYWLEKIWTIKQRLIIVLECSHLDEL